MNKQTKINKEKTKQHKKENSQDFSYGRDHWTETEISAS